MRNTEIINKLIDMKDSRYTLEDAINFVNLNCANVHIYTLSEFENEMHNSINCHDYVFVRACCNFLISVDLPKAPIIGEIIDYTIPMKERCCVIRNINDIIELIQRA